MSFSGLNYIIHMNIICRGGPIKLYGEQASSPLWENTVLIQKKKSPCNQNEAYGSHQKYILCDLSKYERSIFPARFV